MGQGAKSYADKKDFVLKWRFVIQKVHIEIAYERLKATVGFEAKET